MKQILLLLLLVVSVDALHGQPAGLFQGKQQRAATVAGCATLKDSLITHGGGGPSISIHEYQAISFVAGSSYTCCAVEISLVISGTPNFTFDVSLWSDAAGGQPVAAICTASATTNANAFSAGTSSAKFALGTSATIVNGTRYWIVVHAPTIPFDNSVQFEAAGFSGGQQASSGDGVTWAQNSYGTVTAWFKTYAP